MKKQRLNNNSGQAAMIEYVIGALVAVAAVVAMTVYVQRGVQARMYDARNHMIVETAKAVPGSRVQLEYEPYYARVVSDIEQESGDEESFVQVSGDLTYEKNFYSASDTFSNSAQLPPVAEGLTLGGK